MRRFESAKIVHFGMVTFFAALLLFFSYSRVFDEFEYSMLDFRYKLRPPQDVSKDIVIIEIDDNSIQKLGGWPFLRNYHALLVKMLHSYKVKTIVFDVFFREKEEGDEAFAESVKNSMSSYFPYVFELDKMNRDKSKFHANGYTRSLLKTLKDEAKGSGFTNVESDADGKVRRVPAFVEYNGKRYPNLAILAALNDIGYKFNPDDIVPGKKISVSTNFVIPLEDDSSMLINYPGRWDKVFRKYSYVDILQSYLAKQAGRKPEIDLERFKNTICFIGVTALSAREVRTSPLESSYPDVGIHASVYNSVLKGSFVSRLNRWWNLLVLILIWLFTSCVTEKSKKKFASLYVFLIMAVYVLFAMYLFWPFGLWIDVFYPIVSIVAVYVIFTFKKYTVELHKRQRLESELNIAKDIQQSFLPKDIPDVGGVDIGVKMRTARQVGGDLYDLIKLDKDTLGIMIGDVSGKGVPAALYMSEVVSLFRTFARSGSVVETLKDINKRLMSESINSLFVTLTYTVFNTKINTVSFGIAGHLPTLLIKPDGSTELLDVEDGMPLGLENGNYSLGKCAYEPGSIFILYTDGVTEAMNTKKEMFGEERFIELAKGLKGCSAQEVVETIHRTVADFAGRAEQHDDITVIAIKT
ncbi:MAG: CHASE2 domain-containing protein [Candidatus Omnitrophota bacterium]